LNLTHDFPHGIIFPLALATHSSGDMSTEFDGLSPALVYLPARQPYPLFRCDFSTLDLTVDFTYGIIFWLVFSTHSSGGVYDFEFDGQFPTREYFPARLQYPLFRHGNSTEFEGWFPARGYSAPHLYLGSSPLLASMYSWYLVRQAPFRCISLPSVSPLC
jgi:hypothetical protein